MLLAIRRIAWHAVVQLKCVQQLRRFRSCICPAFQPPFSRQSLRRSWNSLEHTFRKLSSSAAGALVQQRCSGIANSFSEESVACRPVAFLSVGQAADTSSSSPTPKTSTLAWKLKPQSIRTLQSKLLHSLSFKPCRTKARYSRQGTG